MLVHHAFDLLNLDVTDLCTQPVIERPGLLAKSFKQPCENIHLQFAERSLDSMSNPVGAAPNIAVFRLESGHLDEARNALQ